jgi:hypothetical protein
MATIGGPMDKCIEVLGTGTVVTEEARTRGPMAER